MKKALLAILTALAVFGFAQSVTPVLDTEQTVTAAPGKHFPMYGKGR